MLYINKSGRRALESALNAHGISSLQPDRLREHLEDILEAYLEAFVYHEIAEIRDPVFDRALWRELVAAFPHTAVELLARSVKDLLADTSPEGPLARMIERRSSVPVGLYAAFQDGMASEIFPQLRPAYLAFSASGDWDRISAAVSAGRSRARSYADAITAIFREGTRRGDPQWAAAAIERRLLTPLCRKDAA